MTRQTAVTFDLDGTVFDTTARDHMTEGRRADIDWLAYSLAHTSDTVVGGVAQLAQTMHEAGHLVIYISGRDSVAEETTYDQLIDVGLPVDGIMLRDDTGTDKALRNPQFKADRIAQVQRLHDVVLHVDDYPAVKPVVERLTGVPVLLVKRAGAK